MRFKVGVLFDRLIVGGMSISAFIVALWAILVAPRFFFLFAAWMIVSYLVGYGIERLDRSA